MSGRAFVLWRLFFMRLSALGSYRCCGLPVARPAGGNRNMRQYMPSSSSSSKFS